MRGLITVVVLIILVGSSVVVPLPQREEKEGFRDDNVEESTGTNEMVEDTRVGEREGIDHYEEDEFGGSWFDDFEDESEVEWMENVTINNGEVRIVTDCVGYWNFEGDYLDGSGNNNHGTPFGNVHFLEGKYGQAASCDGRGDYIDCGNDVSLNFGTDSFTIEAWVKTDGILTDTIGDVASKFNQTNKKGFNFNIINNAGESQSNYRQVGFGIDNNHPDMAWVEKAPELEAEISICSLTVYNSKLYGGTNPNGKLYEWNGVNAWVEKAPKLEAETSIRSLAVYNGKLYGGTDPNGKLYEWNGVDAWVEKAPTLGGDAYIHSLVVYNGKLYGGTSPNGKLYEWNGVNAWVEKALKLGSEEIIVSLAVYNGKLYGGTARNGKLYEWNGVNAWVEKAPKLGAETRIRSLAVYNGKLYGGTGQNAKLYEWNGVNAWVEKASLGETYIFSLAVYNGKLYGSTGMNGKLYEWNGIDAWVEKAPRLGATYVYSLAVYNGKLYGGTYTDGKLYEWNTGRVVTYDRELGSGWHHLAGVKDNNTANLRLYVDGDLIGTSDAFNVADYDLTNDENFIIGFGAQDHFNGLIDEVAVYNRALTPYEISQHYTGINFTTNSKLSSIPIALPDDMTWDVLSLAKTEPANTYINVSVIDTTTNQTIHGFDNLTDRNIDLSPLNDHGITSIRLKAYFSGNGSATPTLDLWGVEWTAENTWRDSFTGDSKLAYPYGVDEHTVGYWRFEEGSGNVARDSSGNGNDGTIIGAKWTNGRLNYGLVFEKWNDRVEIFDDNLLEFMNYDFSISLWFRPKNTHSGGLIGHWGSDVDHSVWLSIYNSELRFMGDEIGTTTAVDLMGGTIIPNNWYHAAITRFNDKFSLYLNGIIVDRDNWNGSFKDIDSNWTIGRIAWDNSNVNFLGIIDEVRISNISRTPQEIHQVYRSGIAIKGGQVQLEENKFDPWLGGNWTEASESAPWGAREDHTSVEYQNKMWVIGGYSGGRKNDVWYSTDGSSWSSATLSAPWSGRTGHTSVVFNNKIWVIGGHDGGVINNDVWYSSDGGSWSPATLSAPWSGRTGHATVVFQNKIWTMGGSGSGLNRYNDVWYSSDGVSWSSATLSAPWSSRYGHTSAVFDNKIWVIGGYDGSERNDVWYSSDGENWIEATSFVHWSGRNGHSSLVFSHKIWVIGGGAASHKNDTWYSSDGVNWIQVTGATQWSARIRHSSIVLNNKLWVIGGYSGTGKFKNDTWYSDIPYCNNATLRSEVISLPSNNTWDRFHSNQSIPKNTFLDISIRDVKTNEMLINNSKHNDGYFLDLSGINSIKHPSIYLEAHFQSNRTRTPVLYDWAVSWVVGTPPDLIYDIDTIFIDEDMPQEKVRDLSTYFHDVHSNVENPVYAVEYLSDELNITLQINGSFLDVTSLAENWTGNVSIIINCTNLYGITTSSNMFNITVLNVNDPPLAILLSPFNDSSLTDPDVTFRWKGSDVDNDVKDITYDLFLDKSEVPALHTPAITGTNITVNVPDENVTYYWYVKPHDGSEYGECLNGTWSFTIALNESPDVILRFPLSGSVMNATEINLTWLSTNCTNEDITYKVYLGNRMGNIVELARTSNEWYVLTDLENGSRYYWKVVSVAGTREGRCSSGIWNFSVDLSFIAEYNITAMIDVDRLDIVHGDGAIFNITLTNNGNIPVTVTITPYGPLSGFVNMSRLMVLSIGATHRIPVVISNTSFIMVGNYELIIEIKYADTTQTFTIPVNITSDETIIDDDDELKPLKESGGQNWLYLILGLALVFVILALGIFFILRKKRKDPDDEEEVIVEADIVKPGESLFTQPQRPQIQTIEQPAPQFASSIKHSSYMPRSERAVPGAFPVPPQPSRAEIPSITSILENVKAEEYPSPPMPPPVPEILPQTTGSTMPSSPPSTPQPIPSGPQIVGIDTQFSLDDIFLIYVDGRLVRSVSYATQLREEMDQDIMSGMLTAITDFIKDSFKDDAGALKTLQHGKMTIYIERGVGMYLAVVFRGQPPYDLREKIRWLLIRLWERYKPRLKVWDGSCDGLDGLDPMLNSLLNQTEPQQGDVSSQQSAAVPGDGSVPTVSTATEAVMCNICMGVVKPGLEIFICNCGNRYHKVCGDRVAVCPKCGISLRSAVQPTLQAEITVEDPPLPSGLMPPPPDEVGKDDTKMLPEYSGQQAGERNEFRV